MMTLNNDTLFPRITESVWNPDKLQYFYKNKNKLYLLHILFSAIRLRLKDSLRNTLGLPSMGEGGKDPVGE